MIVIPPNAPYPAPIGPATPQINWKPRVRSSEAVVCNACQEGNLFWGWNFNQNKVVLVDHQNYMHRCPTPQTRDVFPGWCETCKAPELLWLRKSTGFELTEAYGLPHTCGLDTQKPIQEMSTGRCKYCNTFDLIWVKVNSKYTLTHHDGSQHRCEAYSPYMKDWAEAKRMNYAFEKTWIKSHADGEACKRCKGKGYRVFLTKSKRNLSKYNTTEPFLMHRPCKKCKCIGTFTIANKKFHLKILRKKYWPFKGGTHKWKRYDKDL